ncbi:MAG: hypothetical protein RLT87_07415 [Gammaproteobacteria bacterium]
MINEATIKNWLNLLQYYMGRHSISDELNYIYVDPEKHLSHPDTKWYQKLDAHWNPEGRGIYLDKKKHDYLERDILRLDQYTRFPYDTLYEDLPYYLAGIHSDKGHSHIRRIKCYNEVPDQGVAISDYLITSNNLFSIKMTADKYYPPIDVDGPFSEYGYQFRFSRKDEQFFMTEEDVDDPEYESEMEWSTIEEFQFLEGYYNYEHPEFEGTDKYTHKPDITNFIVVGDNNYSLPREYFQMQHFRNEVLDA